MAVTKLLQIVAYLKHITDHFETLVPQTGYVDSYIQYIYNVSFLCLDLSVISVMSSCIWLCRSKRSHTVVANDNEAGNNNNGDYAFGFYRSYVNK